ncbi:MAG TPA: helix-turn-helix domain-containing protein, partial [Pyrinomonadaceae bacterium]|nr:helix-turn-helix domain-containing protein [Pyrinomonadaceae bacterium]
KTFGVGADIAKSNWFDYLKDLIAQGYLASTAGQYPVLILTETSEDVLKGRTPVQLVKVKVKKEKPAKLVSAAVHPYIQEVFDTLRQLRTEFAQAENVPPYVVFSDATLVEMATYLPHNDNEMRRISGVGDLKFEKYGADFLREIIGYCSSHKLGSRIHLKTQRRERRARTRRDAAGRDTYRITLEMFLGGLSIPEIAVKRELGISTIENHLCRFIPTGQVSIEEFVPYHKIEPILQAVLKFKDGAALSPVKEYLGDDYSYGEIRAVMAAM